MDTNVAARKYSKRSSRDSRGSIPEMELYIQSSPRNVALNESLPFDPVQLKLDPARGNGMMGSDGRPYPNERRPSSASTCGDLEGPHRITPFKHHLGTSNEHQFSDSGGRILSPGVCGTAFSQRSRSRTSNISIKRSHAGKHNSKPDPERKKLLMNQVARYWNECIGLADEEKAHARAEIESLRNELHRQQAKLQDAWQKFDKERTNRQALEGRLDATEKTHAVTCQENSELAEQVAQLKEDLESSKERAKTLHGKHRTYRAKLNEAILEQQRLFIQAKDLYNESIQNLRQENEARMIQSKAIEKALADSTQKRTEVKKCLEELRSNFEKQLQEKQEEISKLETKSTEQDQALLAEKRISDELRQQLESERTNHGTAMRDLSKSVKEFQEFMTAKILEHPHGCELPMHVHQRLHIVEEAVQNCATSVSNQSNFGSMVQKLEEKIITEINPALCDINQSQSYTNDMLSFISSGCATELSLIRGEVEMLSQRQLEFHDLVAEKAETLSSGLECIRDGVAGTQEVCGDIGQNLQGWFTEESRCMRDEQSSWRQDVIVQLTERDKMLDELKRLCHNALQMHSTRFEQLRKSLATKEEGQQLAQAMMEEFRFVLDHELCRDKAKAEHDSKQTQYTLANLETQIGVVVDYFEKNKATICDTQGQKPTATSEHMIQGLQAEAKATEDLRNRWHSDVKLIDSMRSKLESVQKLMPYIGQCHEMMDSIHHVEDMIEHTSECIDQEHRWVKNQLREQEQPQKKEHAQAENTAAATTNTISQSLDHIDHDVQTHYEVAHENSAHTSLQETFRRRVHVHIPTEPFVPALAPSVEQEKRRRRDIGKVPSILKSMGPSSAQVTVVAEEQCNKTETELGPVHEYRKKSVQCEISNENSKRMIHEIGSSFVGKTTRSAFDLPRITDYQPPNSTLSGVTNKDKPESGNDEEAHSTRVKRVKLL
ncbi:hypothetical protein E4U43_002509 [Claviceps pusilla]|uniref:Uncharacterized protein n=1 Tax=Claviceps pusilla TaxID=123648 RepID=A0A9P7SYB4_9HYPO|nr:hypothetical protein E4U43_002509 [Claviceps pusilla]